MLRVIEPATEGVLAELEPAGLEATDAAVARAAAAFPGWRRVTPADRAALLRALADALAERHEDLAVLEARNAGKPIADARGEIGMVIETFRYYAGAPERLLGDTIPVAGGVDMTFREPLGVVGLIVPWNFPLTIAAWKLAPALAAGNTVVLKPAELTPLTALEFERIALQAGIPEGVVNVVAGPGRVCGQRLVEHPGVAKVAFTGSTEVGRGIAAAAAGTIKRVTLELGGKSACVVFADADLEKVGRLAPFAVFAIVFNTAFTLGTGVFASLLYYVLTVVAGLAIQQFVVYAILLRTVARRSPTEFFRASREVYLYAFSTASSNATLPLSIDVAERKLHIPPNIARFVLTVGSTANQNGTALFEGVTVLFLAQVYGLDLSATQQVRVMLMSIVAGIGTAGVPGGSLPMVLIVAQSVGIPAEGMGLILGVDRFLDMCRSAVNVSGDLVIAALVSARQRTAAPVPT